MGARCRMIGFSGGGGGIGMGACYLSVIGFAAYLLF